jgi:hypothetical protein
MQQQAISNKPQAKMSAGQRCITEAGVAYALLLEACGL